MSGKVLDAKLLQKIKLAAKRAKKDAMHEAENTRRNSYRVGEEPVTVRLPFPPSLNHYYRTTVIGKHAQTYISGDGKRFRTEVIASWSRVGVTFDGPVALRVGAVFPDHRVRDIDGLLKGLLDSLEHAGAFANDSQVKLLVIEHVATERPGWVDVVIGPKPGEWRRSVFYVE